MMTGNDKKRLRASERERKKTNKFGTSEFEMNDDDFFETVLASKDQNDDVSSDKSDQNENQHDNELQNEVQSSENISVDLVCDESEYSPGEKAIIQSLNTLSKQVQVLQRIVADIQIRSNTPTVKRTATNGVSAQKLQELGLPLKTLKQLNDFEAN